MKKFVLNISHYGVHLTNRDNYIVNRLLECMNHIKIPYFIIITMFYYCFGFMINHFIPFPKFGLFHSLFTGIFLIAFFSVRYFETQMKEIHRVMAGDNALQPINDKIYRLRHSALNLVIPPLAGGFFGVLALILVNVEINTLSAYYLILTYILCVLVSFLGYLQYVYLFVYIWKLSHNKKRISLYNKDYPANTTWGIMLAELYSNYRNIFFVLGAAYVFGVIYFVLCEDYRVLEKVNMNRGYGISLLLFWGSVFIGIVIFFPTSNIIEYANIKKIIDNLKTQTILDLNKMVPEHSQNNEMKIQKSYLVIAITNTPDYPIADKLGIAFSAVIGCVNLAASVVAILEYTVT